MIQKEYPYIDARGRERKDLVRIYSDLGCRLFQRDTGKIFTDSVVDSVLVHHDYVEMIQDLGELPEGVEEAKEPEETIDIEAPSEKPASIPEA